MLLAGLSGNMAHSAVTTNLVFTTQPTSAQVGAVLANVVVQLRDSRGTNISLAGVPVSLALTKGAGLSGATNVVTDTNGKSIFNSLAIVQFGSGDVLAAFASNYRSNTSSAFNITQGRTTNVLSASASVITYGQPITISAKISAVAPATGTPTGTVTFRDGATVLGTAMLSSQTASLTVTNRLLAGGHNLTATFGGDTNFAASTSVVFSLTVSKVTLTVSGITGLDKVYDARTTASLNTTNALLNGVLSGDNVLLNSSNVRGSFSNKNVGVAKIVNITGLTISGTNSANYAITLPTATASISAAGLTMTVRGANKIYDASTVATVTLADNRFSGDLLTDSYTSAVFTNKNIGSGKMIFVSGLAISGTDNANYFLTSTNATATASITAAPLTVSGITASNKVYDAKIAAGLNVFGALLIGAVGGDVLALNTALAKGTFANKNIGTNKMVSISALTVSGTNVGNYTLTQPVTTASISPTGLTVSAKGVNKTYDGTTAATVTLADNRIVGDVLTDSYSGAIFTNQLVGTNKSVTVTGITVSGTDAANYVLQNTNATTTAGISAAKLLVVADNLSRPFGITNPPLTFSILGFVAGDSAATSVAGTPVLAATASTNSVVGSYVIKITNGTLAAANYTFIFSNGTLTVTPASTASLVTSALNPARTNQNITFVTKVSALNSGAPAPTGQVRFKCNGTNSLGNPVSLTNGVTTFVVPAATIASSSAVIVTAEFSDPAGNFNSSSNSMTQAIAIAPPPTIGKVTITPPKSDGTFQASLSGTPGQTFVLQASSDLIHWTSISTNVADTNGVISIIESNAIAYPSRYYRGMMPLP